MDLYQLIDASQEPILKTHDWIQEAKEKGVGLPHALSLASVSQEGQPSSRMVLLKRLATVLSLNVHLALQPTLFS